MLVWIVRGVDEVAGMEVELLSKLISEGVSLAILIVVLYGIYRLTDRFIGIMAEHLERCCESLERIGDELRSIRKGKHDTGRIDGAGEAAKS